MNCMYYVTRDRVYRLDVLFSQVDEVINQVDALIEILQSGEGMLVEAADERAMDEFEAAIETAKRSKRIKNQEKGVKEAIF